MGSYAPGDLMEIGGLYFRRSDGPLGACVAGGLMEDWILLLQGALTNHRKLLQLFLDRRIT
jgi:hypothetical protein